MHSSHALRAGVGSHHARLGMSKATAGGLGTLTLLASGIGGVCFRLHRRRMEKRALMLSILTYRYVLSRPD